MRSTGVLGGTIQARRSLTETLAESISEEILNGALKGGNRLPTVQALAEQFGVSRTVIREAIALLKADGLIVARHGAGLFVANDLRRRPLRIDPARINGIGDVIDIMRVRLGLEVEAAGRAAALRTAEDLVAISAALKAMRAAARKGESAAEEDRRFHTAIATATGNQYYVSFLEFLGRYIIPRKSVQVGGGTASEERRYLAKLEAEHMAIFHAIRERQPEKARRAMRVHLERGLKRLERRAAEEQRA
jgi:DNA-binding FadR family transcriptional regulator